MKNYAMWKAILVISLFAAAVLSVSAFAQAPGPQGAGMGLLGDWDLKVRFGDRDMDAILSFSRDGEGNLTADWISFWGVNRLKEVKFEDKKLTFVQIVQFRDEEFRSTFTGTVEEDKLTGTLSGDRGDSDVKGQRSPRLSRALGTWELNYEVGGMDITAMLIIKADREGKLSAEWKSERITSEVSDVNYERGTLTLKRKSKMEDRQWESAFEGTIDRETGLLKGTIKSEMGDVPVEGKRMGEALIGTWDLDITAEERQFKQRLQVNPDMSGRYGTMPLEKIEFKDGKVSFKAKWEFGDRTFEMSFDGKLADGKLTGEITTSRGTQKVEGKKIVRPSGRPGGVPRS